LHIPAVAPQAEVSAKQMLPQQQAGESHMLPGQQEPPELPQATQMPPVQVVRAAVQVPALGDAPQQGWPGPPQVPQVPALHLSPPMLEQLAPAARQSPFTQHPPPLQTLAAQHANPGSPHAGETPPSVPRTPATPPVPTSPPAPVETASPTWMLTSMVCAPSALPPPPAPFDPPQPCMNKPDAPAIHSTLARKRMPLEVT
jgi:hypothetical protein